MNAILSRKPKVNLGRAVFLYEKDSPKHHTSFSQLSGPEGYSPYASVIQVFGVRPYSIKEEETK